MLPAKRVVITGIGIVSPLGCGIEQCWKKLIAGESGVKVLNVPNLSKLTSISVGAPVINGKGEGEFNEESVYGKSSSRELSRFISLALVASDLALNHANINNLSEDLDPYRAGVAIGTGGCAALPEIVNGHECLTQSYKKLSPYFVPKVLVNMAAGHVSIRHGLKGPVHSVATACASGSQSIGDAYNFIRLGYADLMLAGGTDAMMDPLAISGFARMKALSTTEDPLKASRPFDSGRNGFVIGEGSGVLVLEELTSALNRNAPIIAEVCGYGLCGDAFHSTSPSPGGDGATRCMKMALRDAQITPDMVGYVNAHATSTPMGDTIEVTAIKNVFTDHNQQRSNKKLFVSSTKGSTGHLLGAAGAVEAAFTALALQSGTLPPTLNLESIDPEASGDGVFEHVPLKAINYSDVNEGVSLRYAASNSFGFGGVNSCLILKRFEQ